MPNARSRTRQAFHREATGYRYLDEHRRNCAVLIERGQGRDSSPAISCAALARPERELRRGSPSGPSYVPLRAVTCRDVPLYGGLSAATRQRVTFFW